MQGACRTGAVLVPYWCRGEEEAPTACDPGSESRLVREQQKEGPKIINETGRTKDKGKNWVTLADIYCTYTKGVEKQPVVSCACLVRKCAEIARVRPPVRLGIAAAQAVAVVVVVAVISVCLLKVSLVEASVVQQPLAEKKIREQETHTHKSVVHDYIKQKYPQKKSKKKTKKRRKKKKTCSKKQNGAEERGATTYEPAKNKVSGIRY